MSWTKRRVYRCDVCGKASTGYSVLGGSDAVPLLWSHVGGRHGFTICEDCKDAVRRAKHAPERDEGGGERKAADGGLVGALQTMFYGGASDGKEG